MADGTPSGPAGHPDTDTAGAGDAGVSAGSEAGTGSGANDCAKTNGGAHGGGTGVGTTADSSSAGPVITLGADL